MSSGVVAICDEDASSEVVAIRDEEASDVLAIRDEDVSPDVVAIRDEDVFSLSCILLRMGIAEAAYLSLLFLLLRMGIAEAALLLLSLSASCCRGAVRLTGGTVLMSVLASSLESGLSVTSTALSFSLS